MLSQKTRSSLTITIGTILVTFGTLVLVALASGYNINLFNGEIFSTGLVLLGTNPSGSSIRVNNKNISQKTPYRIENAPTGDLQVEYYRSQYIKWKANFLVRGGQVTFADYALLIPEKIEQKEIPADFSTNLLESSGDGSKIFGFSDSQGSVYELNKDSSPKKIVSFPPNISSSPVLKIDNNQINKEGSAFVSKVSYQDGNSNFYWVEAESGQTVNLSSLFGYNSSNNKINPRDNKEIYSLNNEKLKRGNAENKKVIDFSLSNIIAFTLDSDHIYTLEKNSDKELTVLRYDLSGNNRYVMGVTLYEPGDFKLEASKLNNQTLLSVYNYSSGRLQISRQMDGRFLFSEIGKNITAPKFSPSGKFISYFQSNIFRTIDIEFAERYSTNYGAGTNLQWLTNYQLLITKPEGLYITDFNGYNLTKIPPNAAQAESYSVATQSESKNIYFALNGKLHYYSLQPKGLINFR